MRCLVPTEQDSANATLEVSPGNTVDQICPNSGLNTQEYPSLILVNNSGATTGVSKQDVWQKLVESRGVDVTGDRRNSYPN